jgi:flagellar biosynthesis protein FlhF
MLQTDKPLFAFGVGAKVPDDLEWATKERVLDLIFKLTKLRKMQELA